MKINCRGCEFKLQYAGTSGLMPEATVNSNVYLHLDLLNRHPEVLLQTHPKCSVIHKKDHTRVPWIGNGKPQVQLTQIHHFLNRTQETVSSFRITSLSTRLTTTGGFDSQPLHSFTSSSSTAAPPFRNPSFTTPRKPFDDSLFSEVSGAESSPADNADAEDTPEPQTSKAMTAFTSKSEKTPLFGRYGAGFAGNSPLDSKRRNKYGNAIVKKVRKRRRIDRDDAALIGTRGSETDSEDESRSKSRSQALQNENRQGWFAAFLNGIESHPNLPNVLSFYAQLTLNFFLVGLAIFGVWTFWSTIKGDVDKASDEAIAAAVADMAKCAANFVENGCQNPNRPPALETVCDNWDFCMNRDPKSVGRAKISAHTFAQIFNSFIEPISYKAMVCLFIPFLPNDEAPLALRRPLPLRLSFSSLTITILPPHHPSLHTNIHLLDLRRPHSHSLYPSQQPCLRHVPLQIPSHGPSHPSRPSVFSRSSTAKPLQLGPGTTDSADTTSYPRL